MSSITHKRIFFKMDFFLNEISAASGRHGCAAPTNVILRAVHVVAVVGMIAMAATVATDAADVTYATYAAIVIAIVHLKII